MTDEQLFPVKGLTGVKLPVLGWYSFPLQSVDNSRAFDDNGTSPTGLLVTAVQTSDTPSESSAGYPCSSVSSYTQILALSSTRSPPPNMIHLYLPNSTCTKHKNIVGSFVFPNGLPPMTINVTSKG